MNGVAMCGIWISLCLDPPKGVIDAVAHRGPDGEGWRRIDVLENTRNFKFVCALVTIDFLNRHGLIADDYPHYREIVRGLRP